MRKTGSLEGESESVIEREERSRERRVRESLNR